MSRLLIAVPMHIEALLVRSGARGASVRRTGMGPDRARTAAGRLLHDPGERLLVVGFCGALEDDAVPGEVIVADEVLTAADEGHEPQKASCVSAAELAEALQSDGLGVRRGSVVCVSRLALGERRRQLREGGAIAVDMESIWLADGAGGRPFDVVRVVLDSPSHELLSTRAPGGALRAARALRRVATVLAQDALPGP